MKKILLTTTILAFAGSAFAATVSGKLTAQYQKKGSEKTIHTKGEVSFSGSKTSSNGITFGGTYKVLVDGAQNTDDKYTRASATTSNHDIDVTTDKDTSVRVTSAKDDGTTDPTTYHAKISTAGNKVGTGSTSVSALRQDGTFKEGTQTESQVNLFVSGSFGRVDMGRHSTAARALGGKRFGLETADKRTTNGITYTTPTFSGFRAAYTWSANTKDAKSIGVGFDTTFSGVDIKLGWGNIKTDSKTSTGWGFSAGMAGFTFEYAQGTNGDKEKFDSLGGKFETGPFLVSYHRKKSPFKADGATEYTTNRNTFLKAEYKVVDGLKVFAKSNEEDKVKKTYIGTTINF